MYHKKKEEIPKSFQQKTYHTDNNCVWLSAALLINTSNENLAKKMIEYFKENPVRFEWLLILKQTKKSIINESVIKKDTLQQILQAKFGYELKKVKKHSRNLRYEDYILCPETDGLYLCLLETLSGSKTHIVGIDCNKSTIYDCMEENALQLTRKNLDYCCGPNSNGLKHISLCVEVLPRTENKQNKTKNTQRSQK